MNIKLFNREKEKEQSKKDNYYINELGNLLKQQVEELLEEAKSVIGITDTLINNIGGKEELKNRDSFLYTKVNEAYNDLDNDIISIKKNIHKNKIRLKEIIEIVHKKNELHKSIKISQDYHISIINTKGLED